MKLKVHERFMISVTKYVWLNRVPLWAGKHSEALEGHRKATYAGSLGRIDGTGWTDIRITSLNS